MNLAESVTPLHGEVKRPKEPRLGPLVAALRHDLTFADAAILVEGQTFPVHRNIICALSDFFRKSFSSTFKEPEKRSLVIQGASPSTVSILLDFAYGIDVTEKMSVDFDLAYKIVSLSHRLQVKELTRVAAAEAASQLTTANCVQLYLLLKRLDCVHHRTAFIFIAQRLEDVSSSPDFGNVSDSDLDDFAQDQGTVVSEIGLYRTINRWLTHNKSFRGSDELEQLLSFVNFELLDTHELELLRGKKCDIVTFHQQEALLRSTLTLRAMKTHGKWDGALVVPPKHNLVFRSHFVKVQNLIFDTYLYDENG